MNSNGFKTYSMAHIGQSNGSAAEEKSKLEESHDCKSSESLLKQLSDFYPIFAPFIYENFTS